MEVRAIRAGEYERVGDLTVSAYSSIPGDHMSGGYESELRAVERRSIEADVLVAEREGGIVGGVTYVDDPVSPWAETEGLRPGEALIRMLAVDPVAQGTGAGRALLEACIERAVDGGKRALVLHTTPWMTTAHRLYESRGFRRLPDRDFLPLPDVPLMAYGVDLPPPVA